MCIPFTHKWKYKIRHILDGSWGGNAKSTMVVRVCTKCYKVREKYYYGVGYLTLKDFGIKD